MEAVTQVPVVHGASFGYHDLDHWPATFWHAETHVVYDR